MVIISFYYVSRDWIRFSLGDSGLTVEQTQKIERVQKLALAAILGSKYTNYNEVLQKLGLDSLSSRRMKICSKFITKNMQSAKPIFSRVKKTYDTRSPKNMVQEYQCRTKSMYDSSLPFLARIFNQNLQWTWFRQNTFLTHPDAEWINRQWLYTMEGVMHLTTFWYTSLLLIDL